MNSRRISTGTGTAVIFSPFTTTTSSRHCRLRNRQQTRNSMMSKPHPNRLIPQQPSPDFPPQQQQQQQRNAIVPPSSSSSSSQTTTTTTLIDPLIHLTRISEPSHLSSLPPEFLSDSTHYNYKERPLLHIDESSKCHTTTGRQQQQECYTYYLNPMKHAVFYILAIEMLERFSFYGINYTTTAYLTGE